MKAWKDVRNGLIEEIENVPDDQMSFRATTDTRPLLKYFSTLFRPKDSRRRNVPGRQ